MNLALLVYELRLAGIKRLEIELSDPDAPPPQHPETESLTPGDLPSPTERPPADPEACASPGCGEKRGGLFRGGVGGKFCRAHALGQMGIRS